MNRRVTLTTMAAFLVTGMLIAILWGLGLAAPKRALAHDLAVKAVSLSNHSELTGTLNTAAVVVQMDDSRSLVRLIDFSEPISGLAALTQSDLAVTLAETDFGPAVCAIEGVGCPSDDCFCDPDRFWAYSFWDGAAWQSYPVGAASSVISTTGAVEGWRWGAFGSAQAPADQALAAAKALDWLRSQQNAANGGFGDSVSSAVEVMMALGANGEQIDAWAADSGRSLASFMQLRATRFSRSGVAAAGKLALASAATDSCQPVRTVTPTFFFSDTLHAYAPDNGFNAWGILGALAVSDTVPAEAVEALAAQQQGNGGWEWQAGFGPDSNTTALALQTLIAAGWDVSSTEVISGLAFLKSAQVENGGFVYDPASPGFGADANSTAYAIQAIVAAGQDPSSEQWTEYDNTPLTFLLSLQLPDGSFEWQAGTGANLLATAQAVPALLGRPYPIAVRELESCVARRLRARHGAEGCPAGVEGCVPSTKP
ncbi:MAG: hypothetical protein H3C34_05210 [Caldilineaceae bacterium]|nr:hypothetical protein [Caldilineaceae bacterium]